MYTPNEQEKNVLALVAQGNTQMAELIDITGLGGELVNRCIEALDENRLITRKGFVGGNFWEFAITEKGLAALPEMSEVEKACHELGVWPTDLEYLALFKDMSGVVASEYVYANIESLEGQRAALVAVVKLVRRGYMREFGFVRRKIEVTESGKALLEKYRA